MLGARTAASVSQVCFYAVLILAVIAPRNAIAGEHPPLADPVHTSLDRCLVAPKTKTTLDIRSCYQAAGRAYEALMAKEYQIVLHHVDPATQALVRASQESWLAYRKREVAAQQGPWIDARGTFVSIEVDETNVYAIHARVVELHLFWPGFGGENHSL